MYLDRARLGTAGDDLAKALPALAGGRRASRHPDEGRALVAALEDALTTEVVDAWR